MGWCSRPPRAGYLRRSNFRRRGWLAATRAAGVDGLRFHDLRHSAATLALAAGANTRELMERMGHTSPAVALRYQHVMAGRDQAIAAALDELVQAAAKLPTEEKAEAPSGTVVARTRRATPRGSGSPRCSWRLTWAVGGGDDGTRTHDPLLAKQPAISGMLCRKSAAHRGAQTHQLGCRQDPAPQRLGQSSQASRSTASSL
jgi:hypothetical protein